METLETTDRLFEIVEDSQIFEPTKKVNGIAGNFMQFERCEDTEDGTFPRVSDYTRLINKMELNGVSAFINWIGKGSIKFNQGYCEVIRDSKNDDTACLVFKKPIKIVVSYVNNEPVIIEVNKIEGEFTYEWYWTKNGRQNKYANGFEIYFDCQKYFN